MNYFERLGFLIEIEGFSIKVQNRYSSGQPQTSFIVSARTENQTVWSVAGQRHEIFPYEQSGVLSW